MQLFALGIAIVATGLVAGVFLAFSDFVMRSLGKTLPAAGCETMLVVNREVYRTVFMALLLGMSVFSVALAIYAQLQLDGPSARWILAGSAAYFVGTFLVTMLFNVPMNHRLDAGGHDTPEAIDYWQVYLKSWARWNTVRTVVPILAMFCYLMSFYHVAITQGLPHTP